MWKRVWNGFEHVLINVPDESQEVNPVSYNADDPTSSAMNVISYDPNKTALQNMYDYAVQNNSASAYSAWLENKYTEEMSNSSIQRAIADAEAAGISKYQLFQSGNAGASVPSAAGTLSTSYENAMNRKESWKEKELAAITKIVATTISSAFSLFKL